MDRNGVHMTHCYQGEYPDTCKYGNEPACPARVTTPTERKTLPEDILGAKFGTKNRSELIPRVDMIKHAIKDIIWMARRYSTGRQTYAPGNFNDAYDILRAEFGDAIDGKNASDHDGNKYHDITIEHTKDHPYALYGSNLQSETNRELKHRKFYK